jgi:hypothetical protein
MAKARKLLLVAPAALALTFPVAFAPAGDRMQECQSFPHVDGFVVDRLLERGLGCEHAKLLGAHLIRHGELGAYHCTRHQVAPELVKTQAHCSHKENRPSNPKVRSLGIRWHSK